MGTTMNTVNLINLAGAYFIFDINIAFYSGLFMWVNAWTLEKVLTGFAQHRAVFIITERPEAVSKELMERFNRGVTLFHATGGYSKNPMQVVYAVINLYELGQLKDIMFTLDPKGYVMVTNTSEVIGRRFHSWEEEGYRKPFEWKSLKKKK